MFAHFVVHIHVPRREKKQGEEMQVRSNNCYILSFFLKGSFFSCPTRTPTKFSSSLPFFLREKECRTLFFLTLPHHPVSGPQLFPLPNLFAAIQLRFPTYEYTTMWHAKQFQVVRHLGFFGQHAIFVAQCAP